jgi:protein-tyrosine phosphatase
LFVASGLLWFFIMIGRIDVHSHLLCGVDDGCKTLEESLECARRLVEAGYTHCVCTPHIWPNLPHNTPAKIAKGVGRLQEALDQAGVKLKLIAGGEHNLNPHFMRMPPENLMTYGMKGQYLLLDLWVNKLPNWFDDTVRWIQGHGPTVILAHPERMAAVQDAPELVDHFKELGVLLQGNLQCLGEPPKLAIRRVGERLLREGRYFMLGSDLHGPDSLGVRLRGLSNAVDMVGEQEVWRLTRDHPRQVVGIESL